MSQNATEDWNDDQPSEGDEEAILDYSELIDSFIELIDSILPR